MSDQSEPQPPVKRRGRPPGSKNKVDLTPITVPGLGKVSQTGLFRNPGNKKGQRPENLRPKKGMKRKITTEIREFAKQVTIMNPKWQERIMQKASNGTLHPAIETTLMHYAFGKPVDRLALTDGEGNPMQQAERVAEAFRTKIFSMVRSDPAALPPAGETEEPVEAVEVTEIPSPSDTPKSDSQVW